MWKTGLVLVTLLAAAPSQARPSERTKNPEPRQSTAELRDDTRDQRRVNDLVADYHRAMAARQPARLFELDRRVEFALGSELREQEREVGQAVREARRSRDRDDRRDLAREQDGLGRLRALQSQWSGLMGRLDGYSLGMKRSLLDEFSRLSRQEVRLTRGEVREDRHQRRTAYLDRR